MSNFTCILPFLLLSFLPHTSYRTQPFISLIFFPLHPNYFSSFLLSPSIIHFSILLPLVPSLSILLSLSSTFSFINFYITLPRPLLTSLSILLPLSSTFTFIPFFIPSSSSSSYPPPPKQDSAQDPLPRELTLLNLARGNTWPANYPRSSFTLSPFLRLLPSSKRP